MLVFVESIPPRFIVTNIAVPVDIEIGAIIPSKNIVVGVAVLTVLSLPIKSICCEPPLVIVPNQGPAENDLCPNKEVHPYEPPTTEEKHPAALLQQPPPIVEVIPDTIFPIPPPIVVPEQIAVFPEPPPIVEKQLQEQLLLPPPIVEQLAIELTPLHRPPPTVEALAYALLE
jgi:hypothetical protein